MFDGLDFIYSPSHDVAADVDRYAGLGAEVVFAIERFGTRVAMVRLTADGPGLVLAQHLQGEQPILVFRVGALDAAAGELERRGVQLGAPFEMPFGRGVELVVSGPQRVAIYERSNPLRGDGLTGRRDF